MVAEPRAALDALIALGIDRVLTSGMEPSAHEGAETIAELHHQAAGRIIIMPGGGINEQKIAHIKQMTGATEFHMSGRHSQGSQMRYRNHRISLGGNVNSPEYSLQITSAASIRATLDALQDGSTLTEGN
jgi:copper homeostasis protein